MILLFDVMHYAAGLLATLLKKTQVNKTFKNWVGGNGVGIQRQVFTISSFWAHLIKLLQILQNKYRVPSSRFAQIDLRSGKHNSLALELQKLFKSLLKCSMHNCFVTSTDMEVPAQTNAGYSVWLQRLLRHFEGACVCVCVCVCINVYKCTYVCICIYILMYVCVCMYVCKCVCVCVCTYVCIYV